MSLFDNHGYFLFPEDGRIERTPEEERNWEKGNEDKALALMNAHWEYHDILQNNKELYVSRGSKIGCTLGSKMVALDLMQDYGVTIGNEPVLTCKDCGEDVIHNFGYCKAKEADVMARGLPLLASGRGNNRNSIPEAEKGNAYPHICIPVVSKNWTQTGIDSLLIETGFEEESAALREHAILVCQYGGIIGIYEVKEVEEKPTDNAIILNDWLVLHTIPSDGVVLREVKAPAEIVHKNWATVEVEGASINNNAYSNLIDTKKNKFDRGSHGESLDKDKRYWVALGPKLFILDYDPKTDSEVREKDEQLIDFFGTSVDVVIERDDTPGEIYYIYCVYGESKAHTYHNGLYQTFRSYPKGTLSDDAVADPQKEKSDKSMVEFIGNPNLVGVVSKYHIISIIVYEKDF